MYAVIKTGGRQAKVREGDVLDVQRLRGEGEVEFEAVLIVGDDGSVISDRSQLTPVKGRILGESRGKKVDVFHYRNKSGYRKSAGHRQTYTQVEITEITAPGAKKAAAKKAPAKKAAEKKPAAQKPAAKKPAEKKPAAEKPAAKKAAEKKPAAKKPAEKKPAAEKPAAEKPAEPEAAESQGDE